jgi:hypothetical protein
MAWIAPGVEGRGGQTLLPCNLRCTHGGMPRSTSSGCRLRGWTREVSGFLVPVQPVQPVQPKLEREKNRLQRPLPNFLIEVRPRLDHRLGFRFAGADRSVWLDRVNDSRHYSRPTSRP